MDSSENGTGMTRTSRSATAADLEQLYGQRGVVFGAPVRPTPFRRECRWCGRLFTPTRDEQQHCRPEHWTNAHRNRHGGDV